MSTDSWSEKETQSVRVSVRLLEIRLGKKQHLRSRNGSCETERQRPKVNTLRSYIYIYILLFFYLVSLLIQLTFGRALGKALCPLQPLLWSVAYKQVKGLEVEPRDVFWKL